MKLLLVTSYLDDGGAEKWMLDTLKNMDRTDVEIDYYFWGDIKVPTFVQEYENLGVKLHFRKLNEHTKSFMLKLYKDFSQFCVENGPYDAVHLNGTKITYQMVIMSVSKKLHIPVRIVHGHNPFVNKFTGVKYYLRELVKKQIVKDATIVGGCSKLVVQNLYGDKALNSSKFHIFKNGIDVNKFADIVKYREKYRAELGLKNVDKVILHIGRFSKEKNHLFLLEVFSEVIKQDKNVKLILVGRGTEKETIFDKIKSLKLESSVIHIPFTSEPEKYYAVSDVLLFPSLYEGLPLVLLEAQASGIPCIISSNITQDVVINKNVFQLDIEDYKSIADWSKMALTCFSLQFDKTENLFLKSDFDIKKSAYNFLKIIKQGR